MRPTPSLRQGCLILTALTASCALAASALAAPKTLPGSNSSSFRGDFETGNLIQFATSLPKDALPGRVAATTDARDGSYGGRFTIGTGDPSPDPYDPAQQRAELRVATEQSAAQPGADSWYGESVYFPEGFAAPDGVANGTPSTYFTQFKRATNIECGAPNVALYVSGAQPELRLAAQGGTNLYNDGSTATCPGITYDSYPLVKLHKKRWYDIVFHVRWSSDPAVGFVEAWVDGKSVLPRTWHATLHRDWNSLDQPAYLRLGNLRTLSAATSSTLLIDEMRVGTTAQAVTPPSSKVPAVR